MFKQLLLSQQGVWVNFMHLIQCRYTEGSRKYQPFSHLQSCPVMSSHLQLFVTPWTVARQVPLSMEFSRQEYWSGLPFLLQGVISSQGLNPYVSCISCIADGFFTTVSAGKPLYCKYLCSMRLHRTKGQLCKKSCPGHQLDTIS